MRRTTLMSIALAMAVTASPVAAQQIAQNEPMRQNSRRTPARV